MNEAAKTRTSRRGFSYRLFSWRLLYPAFLQMPLFMP